MHDRLENPIYNALISGDAAFAQGVGSVRYFDEAMSPFAGFPIGYERGFKELQEQLPAGRGMVYASSTEIAEPEGWKFSGAIHGLQFVFDGTPTATNNSASIQPLNSANIQEMVALAALTKPGPFTSRTIEFGHYHGIFEEGKLAAMTGQRLHIDDYTEISAVCTHPDYLGKGYAAALINHQLQVIADQGKQAFLHVRGDNARAIALYERIGFSISRPMNFYFMKRR